MLEEIEEFIDEDTQLAVKHGAAWLDQNDPEWVEKIRLETLQMNDCGNCILGQTHGNYYQALGMVTEDHTVQDQWAQTHGFVVPDIYEGVVSLTTLRIRYNKLTKAWTEYIKNRRAK